jgi:iron complex outermembrane recepter protein
VNGYDNTGVTPTQSVGSYAPVDLSVRFNADGVEWLGVFGQGLSFGIEARNVFDTDPPYVNLAQNVNGGGGGFDPTVANPVGRLVAATLRKNF